MIKFILFLGIAALLILPILLAFFSAAVYGVWRAITYENRFRKFFVKYDNEEIGRMVASGKIWTGQTADQLKDSKGVPALIEKGVEQDNGQEIWIYEGSMFVPSGLRVVLSKDSRVQTWS